MRLANIPSILLPALVQRVLCKVRPAWLLLPLPGGLVAWRRLAQTRLPAILPAASSRDFKGRASTLRM